VGLGYKISSKIAKELSGHLKDPFQVKSQEGVGTRVTVYILYKSSIKVN
jgi:hypothetical protein